MSIESENDSIVEIRNRPRPLKLKIHIWLRWLHIYLSMVSLFVVLFFSLTGITLNHPEWSFGFSEVKRELTGSLTGTWHTPKGIDWLVIAEQLRSSQGLHGRVSDNHADDREGSLSFKAPGYSADAFFDIHTGHYKLTITSQGLINQLNDLHRGRDSARSWNWAIDVSAVVLIVVSVTGLGIIFFLKKHRKAALWVTVIGGLLTVVLMKLAG